MSDPSEGNIVRFFHIKTNDFATTRMDGAFTTPALHGGVQFVFFTERLAIPQMIEVDQKGAQIVRTEGKQGVVRELHSSVILSMDSARVVYNTLKQILEPAPAEVPDKTAEVANQSV